MVAPTRKSLGITADLLSYDEVSFIFLLFRKLNAAFLNKGKIHNQK